jgi:hypothetical protein
MTIQGDQLRTTRKDPCRLATTADHGLTGLSAIDGVTPVAGDRILAKNQTAGEENGIYLASASAWARATDMGDVTLDNISAGLEVYIQEGTASTKKTFVLTTTGVIVLDTTALVFEEGPVVGVAAPTDFSGTAVTSNTGNITGSTFIASTTRLFISNRNGAAEITAQLPAANAVLTPSLTVRHKFTSGSGVTQIRRNGADTIDGSAADLPVPIGATITLQSDESSDWKIIKPFVDGRDLLQVPAAPGQTIVVRGWAPYAGYIIGAKVRVGTAVTVGAYTLTLTNKDTANTLLNAATFDMTGVSADTVTSLTLSNTYSDRFLPEGGQWTASFASDDIGFDGDGIYIEIQYAASGV